MIIYRFAALSKCHSPQPPPVGRGRGAHAGRVWIPAAAHGSLPWMLNKKLSFPISLTIATAVSYVCLIQLLKKLGIKN